MESALGRILQSRSFRLSVLFLILLFHTVSLTLFILKNDYTYDEPLSIVCGMEILQNRNFQLNPESGILPQILAALPLGQWRVSPPPENVERLSFAQYILFRKYGSDSRKILVLSRSVMMLVSIGTLILLYVISNSLVSGPAALIPPFIYALFPLFTAYGTLSNADMTSAFFFLFSVYAFTRLLRKITVCRFLLTLIAVSGVVLSKMTFPFIGLFCLAETGMVIFSPEAVRVKLPCFRSVFWEKWKKAVLSAAVLLLLGFSCIAVCHLTYSFSNDFQPHSSAPKAEEVFQSERMLPVILRGLHIRKILPAPLAYGLFFIGNTRSGNKTVWFQGTFYKRKNALLLFRALLMKLPPPFWILLAAAVVVFFRLPSPKRRLFLPWFLFAILYCSVSALLWDATTRIRYFLPAILVVSPVLVLTGNGLLYAKKSVRAAFALILLWCFAEYITCMPHPISYIPGIFGGTDNGYRIFTDSSFDWGQDYCNIEKKLAMENVSSGEPVYLRYFGTVPPDTPFPGGRKHHSLAVNSFQDDFEFLPGYYLFSASELRRNDARELLKTAQARPTLFSELQELCGKWRKEGRIPTLSGTEKKILHGRKILAAELIRAYCTAKEPDFTVNGSILCWHLTQNDLNTAFTRKVELLPE